ncbi:hypothetical protein ACFVWG_08100 [Kribbella sp. NPDC058245]|uniref:hypothetical protein n=1 Tax=Kribbella sp. NPDC058245 TaxID=3346399 RepID=UPI0036E76E69
MPELFQNFSGMDEMVRAQHGNSTERFTYSGDNVRFVESEVTNNWMDSAGLDLLGVTHQEHVQTTAAADHQAAEAIAWGKCSGDARGTLAACKVILNAL